MSENKGSADIQDKATESNPKDEFVSKQAYSEVSQDMHKYKTKLRETEAKLNEALERDKAKESEKLAEQKRFEELYQAEKKRADELFEQKNKERMNFLNATKRAALMSELGALEKPEYIKFASLDAIEVREDGEIDVTSLKKVAESFKQEHSVLLKKNKVSILPSGAPVENQIKPTELKGFNAHKAALKTILTQN